MNLHCRKPLSLLVSMLMIIPVLLKSQEVDKNSDGHREKRNVWNLGYVVSCVTGKSALNTYSGYGCYCGMGGTGEPLDETDRCCYEHDNCFGDLLRKDGCSMTSPTKSPYIADYDYKCKDRKVTCDKGQSRCLDGACKCDRVFADCLAEANYTESYRPGVLDRTKMCGRPELPERASRQSRSIFLAVGSVISKGRIFGSVGALIGEGIAKLVCLFLKSRNYCKVQKVDTTDPKIECPKVTSPVYVGAGKKDAVVKYNKAKATDNNEVDKIYQFIPEKLKSGDKFPIGHHKVGFAAEDRAGNVARCFFDIEVKERTCDYRPAPENGMVACNTSINKLRIGDHCSFRCNKGYELVGREIHTCGSNGTWEHEAPLCTLTNCSAPFVPDRAVMESCTSAFEYNSVCLFSCELGFAMAAGADRSLRCGSGKEWIGSLGTCQDTESPVIINCPQNQKAFVESSLNSALVYWNPPTAIDNVDAMVPVMITEGLPPGSNFSLYPNNIHRIVYSAQDSAGNIAEECQFYVFVQDVSCPPIEHAFRLNISCPDGLGYGSNCTFQCDTGYPLVGPSEAFCDITNDDPPIGFWDWGEYTESPFCEVVPCPTLEPPLNGALACDNWLNGVMCQMQCNDGYDIPHTAGAASQAGQWVCADTKGQWRPRAAVSDCSELRKGDTMRLPSRLFYFSGECSSQTTQQEIRRNFIANLKRSDFKELCTLYPDCSVENVSITCGKQTRSRRDLKSTLRRRPRDNGNEFQIEVTFSLVLKGVYNSSLPSEEIIKQSSEQFDSLFTYMANYVNECGLDLEGLTVDPTSLVHEESSLDCEYGTFPEYSTFTCRPCASGSYYNKANDTCTLCPVGTYQNNAGELGCIKCPQGNTTFDAGARSVSECIPKCKPGFYSTDGLFPCAPCVKDTYADQEMQQSCKTCPSGTYTMREGADNVSHCVTDIIPETPCANNPCNSHGVCISKNESFMCSCIHGYSGSLCDVAPDPCSNHVCQNNASCVVIGGDSPGYTCTCPAGYSGTYCQHEIVDGAWGSWTDWSLCSTSCGDGTETRIRYCDHPAPNILGKDCLGPNVTSRLCKVADCPECGPLPRPHGTNMNCEQSQGTTNCMITCLEGRIETETKPSAFSCGPESNFLWSPQPRSDNMPACTTTRFPSAVQQKTEVTFPVTSESHDDIEHFHNNVKQIASLQAPCLRDGRCTIEFQDRGGFLHGQGIYNSTTTITAEVGEFNYMRHGIFDNETAIDGLMVLAWLLSELENVAVVFNESLYDGSLNFTKSNGVAYFADIKSIKLSVQSLCRLGEASVSLLCLNCPPGSYGDGFICTICPVGQYQEQEGQNSCDVCAHGYTTEEAGATDRTACILSRDDKADNNINGSNTYSILIASSVFVLALAVIVLALVVILRRPQVRNYLFVQSKEENHRPVRDCKGRYKSVTVAVPEQSEAKESPPSYEECTRSENTAQVNRQMSPLLPQTDNDINEAIITAQTGETKHEKEELDPNITEKTALKAESVVLC